MPVRYHLGDRLDSSDLVIGGPSPADASLIRHEEYTPYGVTSFGSYGRKRYRYTARHGRVRCSRVKFAVMGDIHEEFW